MVLMIGLIWTLGGCTQALHMNRTSDFRPAHSGLTETVIESTTEQRVILGWSRNTDYADAAFNGLLARCPGGSISGIQTRYSTRHGFLSWTNEIRMVGS